MQTRKKGAEAERWWRGMSASYLVSAIRKGVSRRTSNTGPIKGLAPRRAVIVNLVFCAPTVGLVLHFKEIASVLEGRLAGTGYETRHDSRSTIVTKTEWVKTSDMVI